MTDDAEALHDAPPARLDVPICRDQNDVQHFRADGNNDTTDGSSPGTMFGYFSTFNDWYEINSFWEGHFIERMVPGSFKRTIKGRGPGSSGGGGETPIRVLLDHGFDPQLGDRPLGVPELLEERDKGPYAETPLFAGVPEMIVEGLAAGAYGESFRFQVMMDRWVDDPEAKGWEDPGRDKWKDLPQRSIEEVRLIEFGPTPFPANPHADAGLRSTTDRFYEELRRKDPAAAEQAMSRAVALRTKAEPTIIDLKTPAQGVPSKATPDDSSKPHPKDPPETGHSDGPRSKRHSEAPSNPKQERKPVMADDSTMTALERAARQSEIRERLTEIDTEYNGAELPDEIETEWDSLNTELDDHERAIQADMRRKARIKQLADQQEGERTKPDVPALHRRPDNPFDLAEIRSRARSLDEMPHLYRENALRVIDEMRFHLPHGRSRPGLTQESCQESLRHLLDFVDNSKGDIARRILVTGGPTYQRAFGKYCLTRSTMGLSSEEQRALAVGAGGTGGFAVPVQLDPTLILVSAGSINPLRQIARVEQIVGKEWDGVTTTGITVARAAEAAQAGDNAPALLQPTVKAERVQGFVPFSFEVDQDWAGLQAEMFRLLADAKDQEEASSFVNGDGISPNANGLMHLTAGILAASNVTANTLTAAAVYALENAMNIRFRPNAKFLANKAVYNGIRQLDTAGGAQMWERIGAGQPAELLGYPAYEMSTMNAFTTPTIGDRWMVLGDFSQFLIVDRIGMSVDLIPHLFGAAFRPTGQRGLYAFWRNNSKVLVSDAFRVANKAA